MTFDERLNRFEGMAQSDEGILNRNETGAAKRRKESHCNSVALAGLLASANFSHGSRRGLSSFATPWLTACTHCPNCDLQRANH